MSVVFSSPSDTVIMMQNPTAKVNVSVATEGETGYLNLVTGAVDDRKQDSEELGVPEMTARIKNSPYLSFNPGPRKQRFIQGLCWARPPLCLAFAG